MIDDNISYDPKTGELSYLVTQGRVPEDRICRSKDTHGYIRVSYKGKRYLGHRVAYYLMMGSWPLGDIDHINGIRDDNRWENLRVSTRSQNLWNQECTRGSSKYKGVYRQKNRWIAQLSLAGGYLGSFTCEREAALAYNHAAQPIFGIHGRYNQVFEDIDELC